MGTPWAPNDLAEQYYHLTRRVGDMSIDFVGTWDEFKRFRKETDPNIFSGLPASVEELRNPLAKPVEGDAPARFSMVHLEHFFIIRDFLEGKDADLVELETEFRQRAEDFRKVWNDDLVDGKVNHVEALDACMKGGRSLRNAEAARFIRWLEENGHHVLD